MEQLILKSDNRIYFTSNRRPIPQWDCDMSECVFPDETFTNVTASVKIKLKLSGKKK